MHRFRVLRSLPVVAAVAVLSIAGSAFAVTQTREKHMVKGVVLACAKKTTGALRLVSDHDQCAASETPVAWNAAGRRGKHGAPGANGSAGHDGAKGAASTAGPVGSTGPTGPSGAPGADGTTGHDGATGPTGPAGPSQSIAFSAAGIAPIGGVITLAGSGSITTTSAEHALVLNSWLQVNGAGTTNDINCNYVVDGTSDGKVFTATIPNSKSTFSMTQRIAVTAGAHTVQIHCTGSNSGELITDSQTTVIATG
jgi:Collagen triple helix repeat (20 copies)